MHADGTGERLQHIVVLVQSEGAARQFSVLSVSYASAYETGAFDFVRVHKPDASVIETPTSAAIDMPAPVTREAPLYSDLKESQLPVRSLAAGDTIEYQLHTRRSKAEAPGQFWGAEHFVAAGSVVLSQTLTLEVPSGAYVKVWSPNHPSSPTEHDGTKQWRWESSQTRASGRDKDGKPTSTPAEVHDPDQDPDGRNLPSVAWTTFHSWAEVGDWYRGLALPRAQPDASVRAKADDLTRDAKSTEDQVRALYQFVSTKTRYVGIDLGIGRTSRTPPRRYSPPNTAIARIRTPSSKLSCTQKASPPRRLSSVSTSRPCRSSPRPPSSTTSSPLSICRRAVSGSTPRPRSSPSVC